MRAMSLAVFCLALGATMACAPAVAQVSAADLQAGAAITGLLGLPLGTLTWTSARVVAVDSKETDRLLEVLEVGDRRLPEPVRLAFSLWQWGNLAGKTLPLNQVLRLRVYETGGMVGVPPDAMKETTFVTTPAWSFRTSVVILYGEGDADGRER
jgi:hypothetical protein